MCRPIDITDDRQVTALTTELASATPGVDILVHAAAVIALGAVRTAPVEDLDRQYRVNLRAPFVLTQQLLPGIETRRGQVVFINSSAGQAAPALREGLVHGAPGDAQAAGDDPRPAVGLAAHALVEAVSPGEDGVGVKHWTAHGWSRPV